MASAAKSAGGRAVSDGNHITATLASASKEVHDAIELDKAGNYVEAKAKYTNALCGFLVVLRTETDPARKRALAAKMESYMARAEEIAQYVEGSDDAQGDEDDDSLDDKSQALIDGLRTALHNLQHEQETLLRRLNEYEAASKLVAEKTASKRRSAASNDVSSVRFATDRPTGSAEPASHNFYAVSVTTVLLAFSVQCTIAFALLMQMQVAFPSVDARLVFAASMFASLLAICGIIALACGRGSHTVYFGFPFNHQVRVSTLGIAELVSLVLHEGGAHTEERPEAHTADNTGASDEPQAMDDEDDPETAAAQQAEKNDAVSNIEPSAADAIADATAPSTPDQAQVATDLANPTTADTTTKETTTVEAETPVAQTVDDRLRQFDDTLMRASVAAAADPGTTDNPWLLEAASILDGFSEDEEAALQQKEKVALLWRRARCLVKQARSFSKDERVPILSKAHASAQQAYNLAMADNEACSDPQVLLWYGISIVEYRLPTADGNNEKIQATKDFVDMVTSAYEHSKALPSTDPRRHELLGTCCFVLGCFHIESTKTIMKLGWMLRKVVSRFLPPTSFAEAVEFLEKALDVHYYDTKAAAAWLAVAQQLNGDTNKAKTTCLNFGLDQAYFKADEGLRKNLKRMSGVI